MTRLTLSILALWLALMTLDATAQAPIVKPGAPGQASQYIDIDEASELSGIPFTAADVRFIKDMIPHHQQALDMAALVAGRTGKNEMVELAKRIEASQRDEIAFMEEWLSSKGQSVPDRDWRMHVADASSKHMAHGHGGHQIQPQGNEHMMEGMATRAEMASLEAASDDAFDAMFLRLMINHHQGAITMIDELLEEEGSARDGQFFEFITDLENDQTAEIERMYALAADLSSDPRAGLAAGFNDAESAIHNLVLVNALAKPAGFFDPENPAGLPLDDDEQKELEEAADKTALGEAGDSSDSGAKKRPSILDFANTDMAFFDDVMIAGSYHGFNIYDISNPASPQLKSSVVCPGGQGDVSVVGDLLIMSVEQTRGRLDCGLEGVAEAVSAERFRGLRIFDISDLSLPRQVGAVQTCRGSHTHSVVNVDDERIIVYNSGTSRVRDDEELSGCSDESPWRDEKTALFRIDVIEIPIARPHDAQIIKSPAVFADPETGFLAGLWERGDHGPRTQTTNETNHCHDITVFPSLNIAAGACSGNGILFDITDPTNPQRIDEVVDPGFAYWHSATFSNDGQKVLYTDEWGGGTRPRCRASDPLTWGANAIYDIVDGELVFGGYFKMPAPQGEKENCVAHNGSLIPVPGRDIMAQAWYQGGLSVFDFTDSSAAIEIAFFDRGPIDEKHLVTGGYWSTYWYAGHIFGTEIVRGIDVFALSPSEHISENEIAAAQMANIGSVFNPQTQEPVSWPTHPTVAKAYADQLSRYGALSHDQHRELIALLDQADGLSNGKVTDITSEPIGVALAKWAEVANGLNERPDPRVFRSANGLSMTLQGLSEMHTQRSVTQGFSSD